MAKILIIESELADAQAAKENLSALGHEVELCGEASAGLSLAKNISPEAIVLCVELEVGSGYSVCNKLRKDVVTAAIPLLLTSREATDETFEQHRRLKTHADLYLHKPYTQKDLLDCVDRMLSGSFDEPKLEPPGASLAMAGLDHEQAEVDALGNHQAMTVEVDLDALDVEQAFSEAPEDPAVAVSDVARLGDASQGAESEAQIPPNAENSLFDESEAAILEPLDLGIDIDGSEAEKPSEDLTFDVPDLPPKQPVDFEQQDAEAAAEDEHAFLVGDEEEEKTEEAPDSDKGSYDALDREPTDTEAPPASSALPVTAESSQAADLSMERRDDTLLLAKLEQQLQDTTDALRDMTRLRDEAAQDAASAHKKLEQSRNILSQLLADLSSKAS